jgi:adenylate kinase
LRDRKIYVVAGTPGVGKSTILKYFKKNKPSFQVINFGDVMFDIAREKFKLKNRDEIRMLETEDFRMLQSRVVRKLAAVESSYILNTHASVKTVDGYYPGLPRYVLEQLPIECFVYIHAPLKEIIERRDKDKSRKRDVETIDDLREHDEMNRNYLASYSMFCNSPVKFLVNANNQLEKCVDDLCNLIK